MLTARVQELEAKVHSQWQSLTTQQSVGLSSLYKDDPLSLVSSSRMISDGPITTEGLESFSLSSLVTEVRQVAPSFCSLLCDLGDVRRNADDAVSLQMRSKHWSHYVLLPMLGLGKQRDCNCFSVSCSLHVLWISRYNNRSTLVQCHTSLHDLHSLTALAWNGSWLSMHKLHVTLHMRMKITYTVSIKWE